MPVMTNSVVQCHDNIDSYREVMHMHLPLNLYNDDRPGRSQVVCWDWH